jgi:hypothetical protein
MRARGAWEVRPIVLCGGGPAAMGQLVIPPRLRQLLGLRAGDRLALSVDRVVCIWSPWGRQYGPCRWSAWMQLSTPAVEMDEPADRARHLSCRSPWSLSWSGCCWQWMPTRRPVVSLDWAFVRWSGELPLPPGAAALIARPPLAQSRQRIDALRERPAGRCSSADGRKFHGMDQVVISRSLPSIWRRNRPLMATARR